MTELRERIARTMADGIGDGFDDAFSGKREWIDCRGDKAGRYRDINEPMQCDYLAAADAVLAEIAAAGLVLVPKEPTEAMFCKGDEVLVDHLSDSMFVFKPDTPAQAVYRAMIAAATPDSR